MEIAFHRVETSRSRRALEVELRTSLRKKRGRVSAPVMQRCYDRIPSTGNAIYGRAPIEQKLQQR